MELFEYWDRPLGVRWRGHVLPYRVFSKDQRVSHIAIVGTTTRRATVSRLDSEACPLST